MHRDLAAEARGLERVAEPALPGALARALHPFVWAAAAIREHQVVWIAPPGEHALQDRLRLFRERHLAELAVLRLPPAPVHHPPLRMHLDADRGASKVDGPDPQVENLAPA